MYLLLLNKMKNLSNITYNNAQYFAPLKKLLLDGWGSPAVPTPVCVVLLGANGAFFFAAFKAASVRNIVASCPQAAV
ncbi:hypothetical protein E5S67_04724 [Microcoleus sp. IPMA8]|uniref:Uncharacterized protein n=1 Tax=Microcoleus asticus IPMA8 TaxID=2563858 RepID=A0ABX2D2U4_9CYAN|nr:hypothetical protein [Microcoleus asticus IPMA8]